MLALRFEIKNVLNQYKKQTMGTLFMHCYLHHHSFVYLRIHHCHLHTSQPSEYKSSVQFSISLTCACQLSHAQESCFPYSVWCGYSDEDLITQYKTACQEDSAKIQQTLRKILELIDSLIAVLCSTGETHPAQSPEPSHIILSTARQWWKYINPLRKQIKLLV